MGDARGSLGNGAGRAGCARSWPAVAVEMEEGGRDKTSVQPQQPPSTTPGGAEEKPGGKERQDAGDKDKEQELVRRGSGTRCGLSHGGSVGLGPDSQRPRRPRERADGVPPGPPAPCFSAPHPQFRAVTPAALTSPHHRLVRWSEVDGSLSSPVLKRHSSGTGPEARLPAQQGSPFRGLSSPT